MRVILDNRVWRIASFVVLFSAGTATAEAQEIASTFDQLRVLVKPGDTVRVADSAGREVTGRIADLSASSLALLVAGTRHELPAADVMTIHQRRRDSLANGAKWGFLIGFGVGLLGGLQQGCNAFGCSTDYDVAFGLVNAALTGGLGAGIGVGIDAMISRMQVIYTKAAAPSAVSVTPMLTHERRGIRVSFAF